MASRVLAAAVMAAMGACGVLTAADTVRVSGRVVETSTGDAIPGAKIIVSGCGIKPTDGKSALTLATDESGGFTVQAEKGIACIFEPTAAGYGKTMDRWVTIWPKAPVTLTMPLPRATAVSGKVVDAETGEPVSSLSVVALQVVYERGRRAAFPERHTGRTDGTGAFLIDNLPPGEFVVERAEKETASGAYTRAIWPGRGDLESAQPVVLSAGVALPLGTLKVEKHILPSLSVRIAGGGCQEGDSYEVRLLEPNPAGNPLLAANSPYPAGEPVRLASLPENI